jgi:hypothetical protein
MRLSRLAGHENLRAPCNLNHREPYCSRGAIWLRRVDLLYTFASVAYVSGPVRVTDIPLPYERFTLSSPSRRDVA